MQDLQDFSFQVSLKILIEEDHARCEEDTSASSLLLQAMQDYSLKPCKICNILPFKRVSIEEVSYFY